MQTASVRLEGVDQGVLLLPLEKTTTFANVLAQTLKLHPKESVFQVYVNMEVYNLM
jgi:hypothetical protein